MRRARAALLPFDATGRTPWAIPFAFGDYVELIDWTGRAVREDKRGSIEAGQPRILDRLGIDPEQFVRHNGRLLKSFGVAIGKPAAMVELAARREGKYQRGLGVARELFVRKQAA